MASVLNGRTVGSLARRRLKFRRARREFECVDSSRCCTYIHMVIGVRMMQPVLVLSNAVAWGVGFTLGRQCYGRSGHALLPGINCMYEATRETCRGFFFSKYKYKYSYSYKGTMYQGTMNNANQLLKRINGSGLPSTGLFACTNTIILTKPKKNVLSICLVYTKYILTTYSRK